MVLRIISIVYNIDKGGTGVIILKQILIFDFLDDYNKQKKSENIKQYVCISEISTSREQDQML